MRRKAKIIVYTGIFVLVFLATALARVYLLGSAPERLVKSLGQGLTGTVFRNQIYENENGNRYDLYIPAGLDRMQDQNLILYIHGGSFNSGSKADGETWCRYYAAQGYITASVDYTLQMHGKDAQLCYTFFSEFMTRSSTFGLFQALFAEVFNVFRARYFATAPFKRQSGLAQARWRGLTPTSSGFSPTAVCPKPYQKDV